MPLRFPSIFPAAVATWLAAACALPLHAQEPVYISEFMASNTSSRKPNNQPMVDEDNSYEDWVEIYNAGAQAVNLDGWALTDNAANLRKWTFPAVVLNSGQRLIVWCSDKNRRDPSQPLHTNFKLSSGGEYLALVRRDGSTVAHEYAPVYPPQTPNVSYGISGGQSTSTLVGAGAPVRFTSPSSAQDEASWILGSYTPGAEWQTMALEQKDAATPPAAPDLQTAGLGYATSHQTFAPHIASQGNVQSLLHQDNAADPPSLWMRAAFSIANPASFTNLRLRMKWDDGFIAYLNGVRIASANAPEADPVAWNAAATQARADSAAVVFEEFALGASAQLSAGENILAIHGLNRPISGAISDALFVPELLADAPIPPSEAASYFTTPTPGAANGAGSDAIPPLVLDVPQNAPAPAPGAVSLPITARIIPTKNPVTSVRLHWRKMFLAEASAPMADDGTNGDAAAGDGIYTGVITGVTLAAGEMLRWKVVATDSENKTGRAPAANVPNDSANYYGTVAQDPSLATSQLPVLHWFMAAGTNPDTDTRVRISISYNGEFYDNVGADVHGQSTRGFPKKSYNLDFPTDRPFLWREGAEPVADLKLLTNYADKTKARNTLSYQMMREAGVAAHFAFPVRVQRNGQFYAIADAVEDADDNYLARAGLDPAGALYKMYAHLLPNLPAGSSGYEKKTRRTENAADLNALANGLAATGETRLRYGYDNVNLPATINLLASHILTSNTDVGHKNYYVFRETERNGEWRLLPWDMDLTFGHNWTSDFNYFNDQLYTTNAVSPSGAAGNGNKFYEFGYRGSTAITDMYLRRLRTLRDKYFSPPGGPDDWSVTQFNHWLNVLDPPDITSDADLDQAKWGAAAWKLAGAPGSNSPFAAHSMREEIARVLASYLAPRRTYLYTTVGSTFPAAQPAAPPITFGEVDFNPNTAAGQQQEYFVLVNPNTYAVDLSDWKISGGIDFTLPPGTVIPSVSRATASDPDRNKLYVAREAFGFRGRATSPKANEKRLVVSGYSGQLSARGETLELRTDAGILINTTRWDAAPTPSQQWLRVSEIHYAPTDPTAQEMAALPGVIASDFEYIELANTGSAPLDLSGAAFTEGITFVFPSGTTLPSGQRLVVAANAAALALRHPGAANVIGPWSGRLDNNGERLQLVDAVGETVLDFAYDDAWYPWSEAFGHSLVIIDEKNTAYDQWDLRASWTVSAEHEGTPGQAAATPGIVYERWQNHFTAAEIADPAISGPDATPAGDGASNFLKYALATPPREPLAAHAPRLIVTSQDGQSFLSLEFERPRGVLDIAYSLRTSADLRGWGAPATATEIIATHGDGTETVRLRQLEPLSANTSPLFGSLHVLRKTAP